MDDSDPVRLGVDVGGTFTDVVLVSDGEVTTAKVPTTADQSDGVLRAIEVACERVDIAPQSIDQFRHAMTVATNAMLEGTGARTALVTTDGFADVIEIGRQDRPSLYDLSAEKPESLVPEEHRHELDERATPETVEHSPEQAEIERVVEAIDDCIESVAVSLLHAYAHPETERAVAEHLREALDVTVVASHETLSEFREYERTATTVVDASVTPVISDYLDHLETRAIERNVEPPTVMQSNGGIADATTLRDHGVTTVLSGPAAGVVGAALFEPESHDGIITFDMGGTSSDVGLVQDGEVERTSEATVAGYPVHVPMVDVETVGAGGGSIARIDAGGALRVGPESAGADPGPACYGRGGDEPTVTDANLVLGYLGSGTELGGGLTLDGDVAGRVVTDLAADAGLDGPVEAARGIHRVANATMTRAIRRVTVERGHDPREFALVAFGGAGPMHASALAERLDIDTIHVPRANGVLSALGLLAADERHDTSRTFRESLDAVEVDTIERHYEDLADRVRSEMRTPATTSVRRRADLRYEGQSYELTVTVPEPFDPGDVERRFHAAHERVRGYRLDDEPIEFVTLRVTATDSDDRPSISHEGSTESPVDSRTAYFEGSFVETPVYDRTDLRAGTTVDGPAIFEGGESTVVLTPGWRARVDERGTLVLEVHR